MFLTAVLALLVLAMPPVERWRIDRQRVVDEQQFYFAVHSELRAGASLRRAVATAALDQPGSLMDDIRQAAAPHQPAGALVSAVSRLPQHGRRAALATEVAMESGGRAANVFLRLADRARVDSELALQRRTLTTQARLSAVIVGSLPLLWLAFGGVGRLHTLIEQGGSIVAMVGVAMEGLGVVLVWRMAAG